MLLLDSDWPVVVGEGLFLQLISHEVVWRVETVAALIGSLRPEQGTFES